MEWQPISTAPLGPRILTYDPEIGQTVASAGWRNESPEVIKWEVLNDITINPSHWMPLPKPPNFNLP